MLARLQEALSKQMTENTATDAFLADVASEAGDDAEVAACAAFRREAEAKFGHAKLVTVTVPFGERYIDTTLLRFLRARSGDAGLALTMLGECLELRQQEQLDTILDRPLPISVVEHLHSSYDEGWLPSPDHHGRPVYIQRGGKTVERLEQLFKPPVEGMAWELDDVMEAFIHCHLQMMEYLNKVVYTDRTAASGRTINKFVMLNDLMGMSMRGVGQIMKFSDIMKKMSAVDQLLYPEGLGVMYFLNAPWAFSGPWKLIASFMTEETKRKIKVVSEAYPAELGTVLPHEELPSFLGGGLEGEQHVSGLAVKSTPWFDLMDAHIRANAARPGTAVVDACRVRTYLKVVTAAKC